MLKHLTLVIPTHGRVSRQITLQALPTEIRDQVTLVASLPDEAKQLRTLHPNNSVVVARNTTSIAQKRHWIMQNIKGELVLMMDDDLAFFTRCTTRFRAWDGNAWKLKDAAGKARLITRLYPETTDTFLAHFRMMDEYAGINQPAMIGIGHRRHNDKQEGSWNTNCRMMYAFGIRPDFYKKHKMRFDAVQLREDFHVVLSTLRAGGFGAVYNDMPLEAYAAFGAKGGCSAERSMAQSDAQCFELQKLHPQFVKVVDREYKGSIPRKEVVVAWKKAYESSL